MPETLTWTTDGGPASPLLREVERRSGAMVSACLQCHKCSVGCPIGPDMDLLPSQIMRLVGTTKSTISAIRDRTHWNAAALAPMDPVTLGLCSQIDLDFEVQRAAKEKPAETGGEMK